MPTYLNTDEDQSITGTEDADEFLIASGGTGLGRDVFAGAGGNDTIFGGAGDDELYGGNDHDSIVGGSGNDYIEGGEGFDVIVGGGGRDTIYGGVVGGDINAGGGADAAYAGLGDATVRGGAGNDELGALDSWVFGYAATAQRIYGGDGDDTLTSNGGNDLLDGGAGANALVINLDVGDAVAIDLRDTSANVVLATGTLKLRGQFVDVTTGLDDDSITGTDGANRIEANAGDDSVAALGGDDTVTGNYGSDTVDAGAGDDLIIESVTLQEGTDRFTLGAGDDVYWLDRAGASAPDRADTITDFVSREDRVDFSAFDATYIRRAAFSAGGDAEVRFRGGELQLDSDGDGDADAVVILEDVARLAAVDLIL